MSYYVCVLFFYKFMLFLCDKGSLFYLTTISFHLLLNVCNINIACSANSHRHSDLVGESDKEGCYIK
jgi:hypothetical protein